MRLEGIQQSKGPGSSLYRISTSVWPLHEYPFALKLWVMLKTLRFRNKENLWWEFCHSIFHGKYFLSSETQKNAHNSGRKATELLSFWVPSSFILFCLKLLIYFTSHHLYNHYELKNQVLELMNYLHPSLIYDHRNFQ